MEERILLALGYIQLEEYLYEKLKDYNFVGSIPYKEGVLKAIENKKPTLLIIRETLAGNLEIWNLVSEIRRKFPNLRIIFIAKNRKVGDRLLASLVSYGIYDIIYGSRIPLETLIHLIKEPNSYADVKNLLPDIIFGDKEVLFEAPKDAENKIIYIEKEDQVDKENTIRGEMGTDKDIKTEQDPVPSDSQKESMVQETNPLPTQSASAEKKEEIVQQTKNKLPKENLLDPISKLKIPFLSKPSEKPNDFSRKPVPETVVSKETVSTHKIITFMDGSRGAGNTSLAVNIACLLAKQGYKTIILEVNSKTPTIPYWYALDDFMPVDGLEKTVSYLKEGQLKEISQTILEGKTLLNQNKIRTPSNYKHFLKTLDFMFFSKAYIYFDEKREPIAIKDLALYLQYQLNYDFVVLDLLADDEPKDLKEILMYSKTVFTTLSQDISAIGYNNVRITHIIDQGINLDNKLYYIINRFRDQSLFGKKEITNILTHNQKLIFFPDLGNKMIDAHYSGIPLVLRHDHGEEEKDFQKILKIILK